MFVQQSLDQVVSVLAEHGNQARILSGGTDLLVALREGRSQASVVVDVKNLPEISELSYDPHVGLGLGASVPCRRIYGDATVAAAYPGLMDAARLIGGVQIQGRASIGGNLCNAPPPPTRFPPSSHIQQSVLSPDVTAAENCRSRNSALGRAGTRFRQANFW